jgi:hypothetical protein
MNKQFCPVRHVRLDQRVLQAGHTGQTGQPHRSSSSRPNLNLDLNLHSSALDLGSSWANEATLGAVRCGRCLSSTHSRQACTARIKCHACHEWGHIAASCSRQWQNLQDAVAGRELDNFSRLCSSHTAGFSWFKFGSMTAGTSTPPRFASLGDYRGVATSPRIIPWDLHTQPPEPRATSHSKENQNCDNHPQSELHLGDSAMAYQRVNPSVFVPHGLQPVQVHGRRVMSRSVVLRPRPKHQDLAIVSIEPLPGHQVTFNAIRGVVADFLNLEARVQFKDIQPTHLGQAFVRFKNVYDRDQLIGRGPMHFGDVTLTFVEHRKARNWRAVNFNRECWLLLLGFPQITVRTSML